MSSIRTTNKTSGNNLEDLRPDRPMETFTFISKETHGRSDGFIHFPSGGGGFALVLLKLTLLIITNLLFSHHKPIINVKFP